MHVGIHFALEELDSVLRDLIFLVESKSNTLVLTLLLKYALVNKLDNLPSISDGRVIQLSDQLILSFPRFEQLVRVALSIDFLFGHYLGMMKKLEVCQWGGRLLGCEGPLILL